MATLTGAARVALGPELPPFYTDDDALAPTLSRAMPRPRTIRSGGCRCGGPTTRCSIRRSPTSTMSRTGGFAGSITAALFLRRFVTAAKAWLHFDIYAWNPARQAGPAGGRRMPGGARALRAAGRALRLSRKPMTAFDPRLTPARADLAAKHLEGKVAAARFVEGDAARGRRAAGAAAARARARRAARHRGAQGRARHGLRDHRGRLGLGPARRRRLCRLAAGECAAPRRARRRPTRSRRCARSCSRARRSSCRRSRRCRSAPARGRAHRERRSR